MSSVGNSGDTNTISNDGGEDVPEPASLSGYLSWEQDLQMVSTFTDKKVRTCFSDWRNTVA